jgi:hypothetical protein
MPDYGAKTRFYKDIPSHKEYEKKEAAFLAGVRETANAEREQRRAEYMVSVSAAPEPPSVPRANFREMSDAEFTRATYDFLRSL